MRKWRTRCWLRGRERTLNVENSPAFNSTVTDEGPALAFNGIKLHASRGAFDLFKSSTADGIGCMGQQPLGGNRSS